MRMNKADVSSVSPPSFALISWNPTTETFLRFMSHVQRLLFQEFRANKRKRCPSIFSHVEDKSLERMSWLFKYFARLKNGSHSELCS